MKLNVLAPDKDQPWYADGLSFTCTACGNCCTGGPGYVWLTKEEIVRVAEHLKLSPEEVVERYCRKIDGKFSFKERRRGNYYDCIFLVEQKVDRPKTKGEDVEVVQTKRVCSIYPVRPLQCRTWPFWPENLASQKTWALAGRRCPGMDTGKPYTVEQIHAIRDANDWPKDPPSSKK